MKRHSFPQKTLPPDTRLLFQLSSDVKLQFVCVGFFNPIFKNMYFLQIRRDWNIQILSNSSKLYSNCYFTGVEKPRSIYHPLSCNHQRRIFLNWANNTDLAKYIFSSTSLSTNIYHPNRTLQTDQDYIFNIYLICHRMIKIKAQKLGDITIKYHTIYF